MDHHPTPTQEAKMVRFSTRHRIALVPSLCDLSDEERAELWNTDEDSRRIEKDMIASVRAARTGTLNEDEHSIRGLEHMRSAAELRRRKSGKQSVIEAVLEEQSRQRQSGIFDEVGLSRVCSKQTQCARDLALKDAFSDAAFVRRFVRKPESSRITKGVLSRLAKNTPREDAHCLSVLGQALSLNETAPKAPSIPKAPSKGAVGSSEAHSSLWESLSRERIPLGKWATKTEMPTAKHSAPPQSMDRLLNSISSTWQADNKQGSRLTSSSSHNGLTLREMLARSSAMSGL